MSAAAPEGRPAWVEAAARHPRLASAFESLPPVTAWAELRASKAFFSAFHFNGNDAFELPFYPEDYVYSPVVDVPVNPDAYGHYRRGVKKYRGMIARGETLPPITFLWDARMLAWAMQDGGHRSMAAAEEGLATQPALFAFPKAELCYAGPAPQPVAETEDEDLPRVG